MLKSPEISVNCKNYEYNYRPALNKYTAIHPKLEIKRKKIIERLFMKFYEMCKKYDKNVKKYKTDIYVTLFCWKNITDIDPVIPYKKNNDYN